MTGHRLQDIWKEQCEAARSLRVQYGVVGALDYLIGAAGQTLMPGILGSV
jgi:hypothetical protein